MTDLLDFSAALDRAEIPARSEVELRCQIEIRPSSELRTAPAPMATDICLVFDCSSSMWGPKLEAAIESAKMIVDTIEGNHALSLVAFSMRAHLLMENQQTATVSKDALKAQIDGIRKVRGGLTNLTDGIRLGLATFNN